MTNNELIQKLRDMEAASLRRYSAKKEDADQASSDRPELAREYYGMAAAYLMVAGDLGALIDEATDPTLPSGVSLLTPDEVLKDEPDMAMPEDFATLMEEIEAEQAAKFAADAKRFGELDGYRFLTINHFGELVLDVRTGDETHKIVDLRQLDGVGCACSSSVDFPEEFTKDRDVIEMCRRLRA
jgi:hypothetical protein